MGKLSKEERFKKNPFRNAVIQHARNGQQMIYSSPIKDQTFVAINKETGENIGDVSMSFCQRTVVDKTGYLKIYANGIRMFLDIKAAGIKVFMIIFDLLLQKENYGKDQIGLKYDLLDDVVKENISEATFYRGIKELKKANFLAPSYYEGIYWINTDYVFRGNRLNLVKQYLYEDANFANEKIITDTNSLTEITSPLAKSNIKNPKIKEGFS